MKTSTRGALYRGALGVWLGSCVILRSAAVAAPPQYQIHDIGVVQTSDTASQAFGISNGGAAVGRSLRAGGSQAFTWTLGSGIVGLPNLATRNFCAANSAANNGMIVGTGATTAFGSARLPLLWQNGIVSALPLPAGQTIGEANTVNTLGIIAGSVNSGSSQRAAVFSSNGSSVLNGTTANGSYFVNAFGTDDGLIVVGVGADPNNAARNVGIIYVLQSHTAIDVGALPGMNGAIVFGASQTGDMVGASMLNQGPGLPFIRKSSDGVMRAIPLPTGTTQGAARAVNNSGWAVGTASSAFAIPFLYDGTTTYRLADLIPSDSGWDLSTNTSSSAVGISDNGTIVGTGIRSGQTRAFAMVPVSGVPSLCAVCHKNWQTIFLPCDGIEYRRHIDHRDRAATCPPL